MATTNVPCDVAGCPNPARWYYPKPTLFGWNLCDTCKDTDPRGTDCLLIEGPKPKPPTRAENGFPAMRDCAKCGGSETNEDGTPCNACGGAGRVRA